MDSGDDAHPNSSYVNGQADQGYIKLRQAEDNLRQAKEALLLAQEAYDALNPHSTRWIKASRRKQSQRRRSASKKVESIGHRRCEHSTLKRILNGKAPRLSFFNSLQAEVRIDQPAEKLVSLFKGYASLDKFAKRLEITRRDAINCLKAADFDVLESIATEWENGTSLRDLSQKHGPTPQTISKWIKSKGRQIMPRNSNPRYDLDLMHEHFEKSWSTNRIAKEMDLSWATVQKCKNSWWTARMAQN